MNIGRELLGYTLAATYIACGVLLMAVGALGIDNALGWEYAVGLLLVSLLLRTNLFTLAGCFLYARFTWDLNPLESLVFVLPVLAFLFPITMRDLLRLMVQQRHMS